MPSHNSHSLFHTAPKRLNGLKRKDLDLTLKCRFLNLTWLWNDFAKHRESGVVKRGETERVETVL